jgi:hypothetical protein
LCSGRRRQPSQDRKDRYIFQNVLLLHSIEVLIVVLITRNKPEGVKQY